MKKFVLIGRSLQHSMSPQYFKQKIQSANIDADFQLCDWDSLSKLYSFLSENIDIEGFTVTSPYKIAILDYLHEVDNTALQIGAVNVVKVQRENGLKLIGFNTDCIGFEHSLSENIDIQGKNVIILGNGGAAQMAQFVLRPFCEKVDVVSRKKNKQCILYEELTSDILLKADVIINATPLGMLPNIASCPNIDYSLLTSKHLLFDMIYNPSKTLFLQKGQFQGAKIVNGWDMFCYQADAAWKIWNN